LDINISTRPFKVRLRKPQPPKPQRQASATSQTRETYESGISIFNAYNPLKHNMGAYRELREKIPFFNVAIKKLVQLIGDPIFDSPSDSVKKKIEDFVQKVQVNRFGRGLGSFLDELEDSAFEVGGGWGELVPTKTMTDVHRLKIASAESMCFIKDEKTGELVIGTYKDNHFMPLPVENMDLIYYLAFDRRQGHPQGYSLLYSCMWPSQAFLRWEKSFENQVQRFGDISLVGAFAPPEGGTVEEADYTRDKFMEQLGKLSKLKRRGNVTDIGLSIPPGGTWDIKTLGADAKLIATKDSVRTLLEQLIANTGLHPSSLGVHWSTSERMSVMQNLLLMSNLNAQRERINPIVERIIDTMLELTGDAGAEWSMKWPEVMLLGETERADAKKSNWEAIKNMLEALEMAIAYGWADEESARETLDREGFDVTKLPSNWYAKVKERSYLARMAREIE